MRVIKSSDSEFKEFFNKLLNRGKMDIDSVTPTVQTLLNEIKEDGDNAICAQVEKFD